MKLNRLKDDFFRMISHEVRTPANGLLGIGALIVQQYMEGEAADEYKDLLRQSGQRLENLLDDMALLLNLQEDEVGMEEPYPLEDALNRLRRQNPAVEIQLGNEISPQQMLLKIEPRMLDKVLTVFTRLAGYFMTGDTLSISVSHEYTGSVHMQIELDNLVLTDEQLNGFFSIDSPVRGFTPAQSMGIAPVVASSVLDVCGGSLQFTRDHDAQGRLTAIIPSSMGEQHD
ncbi:MAG: sensor histidine kinase [Spirochaeta sp.]